MAVTQHDGAADGSLDLFISYARRDLPWARWLVSFFEQRGHTVVYQHRDFGIGEDFWAQINDSMRAAAAVVLVLSNAYAESEYTKREWTAALEANKRLFPIRIDDDPVPPVLASTVYVDVRGLDRTATEAALNDALDKPPALPASAPNRSRRLRIAGTSPGFPGRRHHTPVAPADLLGRDRYLLEIDVAIQAARGPVAIVPQPLETPGRGCTALAAEYVQRRSGHFDTVFWIPAEPLGLLPIEFARIGRELDLPPRRRAAEDVHAELETHFGEQALLVFDSAPEQGRLEPWLPNGKVRVLVTSTSSSYEDNEVVELGPLTARQVRESLAAASGVQSAEVDEVLERLQGDPAAVVLAARWLQTGGDGLAAYLEVLDELLGAGSTPAQAAATASVDALDNAIPDASRLLVMLSRGAPRGFPLAAFDHAIAARADGLDYFLTDAEERERALDMLVHLGLGYEGGGVLAVNRVAAAVAARRLDDHSLGQIDAVFAGIVQRALDQSKRAPQELLDGLAAHAYALGRRPAVSAAVAAQLAAELARYAVDLGVPDTARAELERVRSSEKLALCDRVDIERIAAELDIEFDAAAAEGRLQPLLDSGLDELQPRQRADVLATLARARSALGDHTGAREAFEAALDLLADRAGMRARIDVLHERGAAERRSGEHSAAEKTAEERYRLAAAFQGQGRLVSDALGDRGIARLQLGNAEGADSDLSQAVADMDGGASPLRLAELCVALAEIRAGSGELAAARMLLGRASALISQKLGRQAPELAPVLHRIADTYLAAGEATPASSARSEALRRRARTLEGANGDGLLEGPPLDGKVGRVIRHQCVPIIGPRLTDRVFTPRKEIAREWAEHEKHWYPMADHHKEDLPHVAQYLSIRMGPETFRRELEMYFLDRLRHRYGASLSEAARRPLAAEAGAIADVVAEAGRVARWADPFEYHAVLARLPSTKVYITTGPAPLLTEALEEAGRRPTVVSCDWLDERHPGAPESFHSIDPTFRRPLVLHLFGDFRNPSSVLLAEREYLYFVIRHSMTDKAVPLAAKHAMVEGNLLFLGFDLDEWDFNVLLQTFVDRPGARYSEGPHAAVQIGEKPSWRDAEAARLYLEGLISARRPVDIIWERLDDLMVGLGVALGVGR